MQDRSPAALCRGLAEAKLVRGNFLRIPDLRSRPANISVAASRTTVRRRIVETSEPDRRQPDHEDLTVDTDARGSQEARDGLPHPRWLPPLTGPLKGRCGAPLAKLAPCPRSACGRPLTALPLSDAPPNPLGRKFRDPLDKPFHISAPTTRDCSMVLGGAERWTRPCSACIRVAQRVSENNGGTSFKLLVRGSSPRRPTKGLVGGGVFDPCCPNYGSAPTLTRN